jgi:hypothetical protein
MKGGVWGKDQRHLPPSAVDQELPAEDEVGSTAWHKM